MPPGKPDLVTDAAGRVLDMQYDPKNFLERITDPAGNYQSFDYTALGNIESESVYTAAGVLAKTLRYEYGDPLTNPDLEAGKPWKAVRRNHDDTAAADLETVFAYDVMGNLSSATDPENNTTTYLYDNLNRLDCVEQPGQTVTEYDYDGHGNLVSVTDPEGLLTQYLYDDLGRLVRVDSPDTGTVYYAYDEAGNMVREDANGRVTTYTYDDANRRTDTAYADGSGGVTYTYDSGSGQHLKGRLAAVIDNTGERHFSYDANGFVDTEQRIIQGVTYLTDYAFDPAGNLRSITYPTGQTVDYQPDGTDVGRVAAVHLDPAGADLALADGIAYKPFGPVSGLTLGNGLQTSQSYDLNYQVAAIASGGVLNRTYTPDNNGNILTITDNLDAARSQGFTYDSLQRLTHAAGIYGSLDFTYDKTGNRQTRTAGGATDIYTYFAGTNQLDTVSGSATVNFDHDLNGNLIGRTYVTGPAPGQTSTPDYAYTHDGQRTAKTIDGQTFVYHYDIAGQLIAETDGVGNLIKAYVWLHGQPLAQIGDSGSVYYYHNDHLGTPQKMTDGSGGVVWAADYLPFGKADVIVGAVENNLRFAGQYYDQETGLHYNYHRYYDPSLGRYLRADPIGLAGGINLYAYVQNNPVNYIDPLGLKLYITVVTSAGGGIGPVSGEGGVIYAFDPESGDVHGYSFAAGGLGLGFGGGATAQVGIMDMESPSSITGWGLEASAFIAAGLGASAQVSGTGPFGDGAVGGALGIVGGVGAGISGMVTYTWYEGKINIYDLSDEILNMIQLYLDAQCK